LRKEEYLWLNRIWKQLDRFGFKNYEIKKDMVLFFLCLVLVDKKNDKTSAKRDEPKNYNSFNWAEIASLSKSDLHKVFYEKNLNGRNLSDFNSEQIQKYCSVQLWNFRQFPDLEPSQLFRLVKRVNEINLNIQSSFSTALHFLQEKKLNRHSGQCFTPLHIAHVIGVISQEFNAQSVLDPSCGIGDLLSSLQRYQGKIRSLEGWEIDPFLADCASFNLWLTGNQTFKISNKDTLDNNSDKKQFDLILANPPFGNGNPAIIKNAIAKTKTSRIELVFLDRIMTLLKDSGLAIVVLPLGFLHSTSKAHLSIRKRLVEEFHIEGIVEFPKGVFLPATVIRTVLLVFTRHKKKLDYKTIWHYKLQSDGFSADKIRKPIPENDLPDLLNSWKSRNSKNEKSKSVNFLRVTDIQQNNYVLIPNSEKKEEINIPPSSQKTVEELFDELKSIEEKRRLKLLSLEKLMNERYTG
jgi:type I restriction enzyme M protein